MGGRDYFEGFIGRQLPVEGKERIERRYVIERAADETDLTPKGAKLIAPVHGKRVGHKAEADVAGNVANDAGSSRRADPGAEGVAGEDEPPAMDRMLLKMPARGRGVPHLARAFVIPARTCAHAPEIELQRAETCLEKALVQSVHHVVPHGPPVQGVGMADNHAALPCPFPQHAFQPFLTCYEDPFS
jgi:hypothetical protein